MYPGMSDLTIVDEHGLAYFVEIKDVEGTLSKDQREFRDFCIRTKKPWAMVHNVTEMHAAMVRFALTMRSHKLQ